MEADQVSRRFGVTTCSSAFIFLKPEQQTKVKSCQKWSAHQKQSRMPCLTDPFVHRRDHAVATTWCRVTEGQSKRLRGCATQQLLPSPEPHSSTIALQVPRGVHALWDKRVDRGIPQFRRTIGLRPPLPTRRVAPCTLLQQAQGTCALCVCGPAPRFPRPWWLHLARRFRPGARGHCGVNG